MAAAATVAAATTAHRSVHVIVGALFAAAASASKDGEQAAHLFAVAFLAHDIIGVLVADKQFELRFAVRAIILVQWHKSYPPTCGKRIQDKHIVIGCCDNVKLPGRGARPLPYTGRRGASCRVGAGLAPALAPDRRGLYIWLSL